MEQITQFKKDEISIIRGNPFPKISGRLRLSRIGVGPHELIDICQLYQIVSVARPPFTIQSICSFSRRDAP